MKIAAANAKSKPRSARLRGLLRESQVKRTKGNMRVYIQERKTRFSAPRSTTAPDPEHAGTGKP